MPSKRPPKQVLLFRPDGTVARKPRKRRRGVALGRRPRADRVGCVPHQTREDHSAPHPVHVSIRRVKQGPSLRAELVYATILGQLRWAKRLGIRVVHYSVQHDHLHLIVENPGDRRDLSAQMRRLFSRLARAVNSVSGRRGSLFRDRHHRRELRSPREMRNALVYVLFNDRKHSAQTGLLLERELYWLDDRSSAAWLTDWAEEARPPPETVARLRARQASPALDRDTAAGTDEWARAPVSIPTTWLAHRGWFSRGTRGRLRIHEMPRFM